MPTSENRGDAFAWILRFSQVGYPGRQLLPVSLTFLLNGFALSKAKSVKVDVTDFLGVKQLVNKTVERSGRLDDMFNNTGIASGTKLNWKITK
ncbi:MAG: hypothetical protein PVG96_06100 [Desulfobacterales bacterium]|jgi:NAD(P)-dependent dehydrogenase (short-subunit alcohol dehydrogenase family)